MVRATSLVRETAKIALANLAYNTRRLVWIDGRNRPRLTPPCGSARFPPVERDAKSRGGPSASRRAGPTSIAPPNRLLKIPYGCNQSNFVVTYLNFDDSLTIHCNLSRGGRRP
jgi:hypothetical protein